MRTYHNGGGGDVEDMKGESDLSCRPAAVWKFSFTAHLFAFYIHVE
jgi:hypothetical protein